MMYLKRNTMSLARNKVFSILILFFVCATEVWAQYSQTKIVKFEAERLDVDSILYKQLDSVVFCKDYSQELYCGYPMSEVFHCFNLYVDYLDKPTKLPRLMLYMNGDAEYSDGIVGYFTLHGWMVYVHNETKGTELPKCFSHTGEKSSFSYTRCTIMFMGEPMELGEDDTPGWWFDLSDNRLLNIE